MKKNNAIEALNQILQEDSVTRRRPTISCASHWIYDQIVEQTKIRTARHVTGKELLEGIRRYALQEYGAMSKPC